ncbi:hypothetical protein MUK42_19064 [Musa troglodytarum]|uniref:Uncharacterized protein n=1 Tax=Musa troglodytarum TaxID=320322 RepID=A0A9E7ELW9_9LILI|nr:hypothetical protein MUK42_19064 [Musa troglodytarum]
MDTADDCPPLFQPLATPLQNGSPSNNCFIYFCICDPGVSVATEQCVSVSMPPSVTNLYLPYGNYREYLLRANI